MSWETPKLELYDKFDPKDFLTALPDDYKESNKPLIVYVATDSDLPDVLRKVTDAEQNVFRDENVALGGKLFRAVRLKGDKINKSHVYWSTLGGKELPRAIVVDAAGQKVGGLEGNDLSASGLFKLMKKASARTFKTDLEKVVKESRSLLDEMDQVEAKQKVLEERKKTAKQGSEKSIAEEEARLAQQMQDIEAREAELLKRASGDRKVTKN